MQVARIRDFAVVGIPFETFAEIGLALKSGSPFGRTMVVGLANGRHGYLPTPDGRSLISDGPRRYDSFAQFSKKDADAELARVEAREGQRPNAAIGSDDRSGSDDQPKDDGSAAAAAADNWSSKFQLPKVS